MAGLLDFLVNDPGAQMGIGLLAAGGPSTTPMNVGQRVQMAMQGMNANEQNKLKLKLLQSQVDENASQNALRQSQLARQQRQDAYFMGDGTGGGVGAPSAPAAAGLPGSAGIAGGAPMAAPGVAAAGSPVAAGGDKFSQLAAQYGVPRDFFVMDYMNNGGKGIAEMIAKRGTPNWQNVNGNLVDTNAQGFKGGLQAGMASSADGKVTAWQPDGQGGLVVGAPRGAIDTFRAFQGAAADFKPIKVFNPATQREEFTSEGAVVGGVPRAPMQRTGNPMIDAVIQTESGGNPNAVSPRGAQGLMQVMPGTNAAPGFGVAPARNGTEAERTRVGQEYLTALTQKYQNPTLAAIAYNWGPGNTDMWLKSGGDYTKLPAETKNYVSAVMTRTAVNGVGGQATPQSQAAPSGNFAAGPSMQETTRAKFNDKMAGEQGDLLTKSYTSAQDASNAIQGIQESRKAMQAGAFQGTGAEAKLAVAKFGQAVGINIDPEKATNTDYLKSTLGNGLLEKAKTLGSNPSNADASRITDIVGSIGKDPNAMKKILDWQEEMAVKSIEGHNTRVGQAEGNGFASQFDMRVKRPEAKPAAPIASMRFNPATGKIEQVK